MSKKLIALLAFVSFTSYLNAKECSNDDLKNEIKNLRKEFNSLSKRIDSIETQQKNALANFKNDIDSNKLELSNLRKDLTEVKNKSPELPNDLVRQIEEQQRNLMDSKELGHVLAQYSNNPYGMPALHYAIQMGDANAVNLLLANGADVNSVYRDFYPNQISISALSRAAICNNLEIAQILLGYGADIDFLPTEENCCYPIKYAAEFGSGDLVTLLIAHEAKIDRIKQCRYGSDVYEDIPTWIFPETPLHVACKKGNYDAVVALLNAGANIDARLPNPVPNGPVDCRETPLEYAANNLKYNDNPQNLELIKLLVAHGATRRVRKYHDNQYNSTLCPVISGYLKSVGK